MSELYCDRLSKEPVVQRDVREGVKGEVGAEVGGVRDLKWNRVFLTVDLKTLQKMIWLRVVCTQTYSEDKNNSTPPHSDDDDNTAVSCTMEEWAKRKLTLTRHRMHGVKVRIN